MAMRVELRGMKEVSSSAITSFFPELVEQAFFTPPDGESPRLRAPASTLASGRSVSDLIPNAFPFLPKSI
jgi:hypothetical protein